MMDIKPSETVLTGQWILEGGRPVADDVCKRILALTKSYLVEIGRDASGWNAPELRVTPYLLHQQLAYRALRTWLASDACEAMSKRSLMPAPHGHTAKIAPIASSETSWKPLAMPNRAHGRFS